MWLNRRRYAVRGPEEDSPVPNEQSHVRVDLRQVYQVKDDDADEAAAGPVLAITTSIDRPVVLEVLNERITVNAHTSGLLLPVSEVPTFHVYSGRQLDMLFSGCIRYSKLERTWRELTDICEMPMDYDGFMEHVVRHPRLLESENLVLATNRAYEAGVWLLKNEDDPVGEFNLSTALDIWVREFVLHVVSSVRAGAKLGPQSVGLDADVRDRIEQACDMVKEKIRAGEPVDVDELCGLTAMSRTHLWRKFKEHVGDTPLHWIRRFQLEQARQLLRDMRLSIPEVAERCGFRSENTFYRFFRRETGLSPSDFRRGASGGG